MYLQPTEESYNVTNTRDNYYNSLNYKKSQGREIVTFNKPANNAVHTIVLWVHFLPLWFHVAPYISSSFRASL